MILALQTLSQHSEAFHFPKRQNNLIPFGRCFDLSHSSGYNVRLVPSSRLVQKDWWPSRNKVMFSSSRNEVTRLCKRTKSGGKSTPPFCWYYKGINMTLLINTESTLTYSDWRREESGGGAPNLTYSFSTIISVFTLSIWSFGGFNIIFEIPWAI